MSNKLVLFIDDYACSASLIGERALDDHHDLREYSIFSSQVLLGNSLAFTYDLCPEVDRYSLDPSSARLLKNAGDDDEVVLLNIAVGYEEIKKNKKHIIADKLEIVGLSEFCSCMITDPDADKYKDRYARYATAILRKVTYKTSVIPESADLIIGIPTYNAIQERFFDEAFQMASKAIGFQNCVLMNAHHAYHPNSVSSNFNHYVNVFTWRDGFSFQFFHKTTNVDKFELNHNAIKPSLLDKDCKQIHLVSSGTCCRVFSSVNCQEADSVLDNVRNSIVAQWSQDENLVHNKKRLSFEAQIGKIAIDGFRILGCLALDSKIIQLINDDSLIANRLIFPGDNLPILLNDSDEKTTKRPPLDFVLNYLAKNSFFGNQNSWSYRMHEFKTLNPSDISSCKQSDFDSRIITSNRGRDEIAWFGWKFRRGTDEFEAYFRIANDEYDLVDFYLILLHENEDSSYRVVAKAGSRSVVLSLVEKSDNVYFMNQKIMSSVGVELVPDTGMTYRLFLSDEHKEISERKKMLKIYYKNQVHDYSSLSGDSRTSSM